MIAKIIDVVSNIKTNDNKLDKTEVLFLTHLYNSKSGGGPVADDNSFKYINPEFAIKILTAVVNGKDAQRFKPAAKKLASDIIEKIQNGRLNK